MDKNTDIWARLIEPILVGTIALLGCSGAHALGLHVTGPTATFAPGPPPTLTGLTVTVDFLGTVLPAGSKVSLQFTTGTGKPIGPALTGTIGAAGLLTLPPPPIPAAAAGLGNKLEVDYVTTSGLTYTAYPLVWYDSGWIWTTPAIKVDPPGFPGQVLQQRWYIQQSNATLRRLAGELPEASSTVTQSNFDLVYAPLPNGLFSATVASEHSFMRLSDNTYIAVPQGSPFGTLQVAQFDGNAGYGSFNFQSIGLSGDFTGSTTYTGGVSVDESMFDLPAISIQSGYVLSDAIRALTLAAGLDTATPDDASWLNAADPGDSPGTLDIANAVAILRNLS